MLCAACKRPLTKRYKTLYDPELKKNIPICGNCYAMYKKLESEGKLKWQKENNNE